MSNSSVEKILLPSDRELHDALEHYLLSDPDRQITQLGGVDTLLSAANQAENEGNTSKACTDYEYAAKIEIYQQNKDSAKKCLILAERVTETDGDRAIHKTLLDNMDEIMRISKEYYFSKRNPTAEEKEEEKEAKKEGEDRIIMKNLAEERPPAPGYPSETVISLG
ncbi:MAG: hypothetical protein ACYC7D_00610 [Nitrososphaerales archaeon]